MVVGSVASPVLKSVSVIDCPAPLSIGFGSTASTNRHAPNINTKPSQAHLHLRQASFSLCWSHCVDYVQDQAAVSAAIEALALQTLPESSSVLFWFIDSLKFVK
jgi:hypothetical protein